MSALNNQLIVLHNTTHTRGTMYTKEVIAVIDEIVEMLHVL
jgi:hypothetical protein